MAKSSPFMQAAGDEKGLLGGYVWLPILGFLLGLLLICCLIVIAMIRKRGSTQAAELPDEVTENEFDGTATGADDLFFISEYGLSGSDGPWDPDGKEEAGGLICSDGKPSLEDTGDGFASQYGLSE